ncbi:MAG: MFS transporter [Sphingomonadales bacterium]|nr:MFS transporter [Sphingomonadales bacterium]
MPASFAIGWRQVGICFLLLSASGMIAATYSIVAVPLAQEFRPSRMVLMLTMTVYSGASAVLMPLVGNLMDRVSVRKLMIAGGVFLAAGYAAISLAATFMQVLLAFGLLIAPANVLIGPVAVTVLLSRWFADLRGRAIGIAIAGIAAGGFVFPMIIQGLLDGHPWREALRLLALVLLTWTVPAALLVVDSPAERGLNPDGAAVPSDLARAELAREPISAREVLSDPAFWMIAATVAIVTAGMKGMVTNLAPLAIDNGIAPSTAATLISVYAGCGLIAKLSFAALADRVGPRALMFAALGGFALGIGLLTQASLGYGAIALGVACIGLFGGMMVPVESFIAPRVFGQRAVGRAMGLLSGVILIALLATPPLFGLIFDLTGSYSGIFWTFSGLGLAGLLWLPAIRLHPREQRSAAPVPVPAE